MSLSHNSSGSDLEFWNQLEDRPTIDEMSSIRRVTMRHVAGLENYLSHQNSPLHPSQLSPDTVNAFQEYLRSDSFASNGTSNPIVDRIRAAKEIEIQNITLVTKSKLKKKYKRIVGEITNKLKADIQSLEVEIDDLKCQRNLKDKEISMMSRQLLDQETILGVARIRGALGHIRRHTRHYKNNFRRTGVRVQNCLLAGTQEYNESINQQMDAMNQMTEIYKTGLENANNDIIILKAEKFEIEKQHQKDLKALGVEMTALIDEKQAEIDRLNAQIVSGVCDNSKEILLRDEVAKRDKETIASLKDELATAKQVIVHPRMKNAVFSRLSEAKRMMQTFDGQDPRQVQTYDVPRDIHRRTSSSGSVANRRPMTGTSTLKARSPNYNQYDDRFRRRKRDYNKSQDTTPFLKDSTMIFNRTYDNTETSKVVFDRGVRVRATLESPRNKFFK